MKSKTIALILSIFLGSFGIDRFYLGHIGTGILKLITFGGWGIWWLIDIILIATDNLSPKSRSGAVFISDRSVNTIVNSMGKIVRSAGDAVHSAGSAVRAKTSETSAKPAAQYPVNSGNIPSGYGLPSLCFGIAGTLIFGLVALILTGIDISSYYSYIVPWILTAASVILMLNGGASYRLRKHYAEIYNSWIDEHPITDIEEFASNKSMKPAVVTKEFEALLHKGVYPQGHLSSDKRYFFRDNDAYEEYRYKTENTSIYDETDDSRENTSEARETINAAEQHLRRIKRVSEEIHDKAVKEKIGITADILQKILEVAEEHPERAQDMRKLVKYYLPPIQELIDSFILMEKGTTSENEKSMLTIEQSLDNVNYAFKKLYEKMIHEESYNIYSNAKTLDALFAKDGLKKETDINGHTDTDTDTGR